MNFWREKRKKIYFIILSVIIVIIGQYFLFKHGVISPLVKGVEFRISEGNYMQTIDEYIIKLGESIEVNSGNYIVIPPYASKPKISYKASNPDILSIDKNTITGIKEGYSAIMVTKNGRAIKKATIRVVDPKVENLEVDINQDDIRYVGDTTPINVSVDVDFDFHEKEKYTYEISNEDVLKIEDNTLKAIGVGNSKLSVKSGDKVKEYNFNVQAKVSNIYVSDNINLHINETIKLDTRIETSPKNLEHPEIKYELLGFKLPVSRSITMPTENGTITGIREGSEKIKITCGNKSKIVTVNVLKEDVESKKVKNLEVISKIDGDKLVISLNWDYLEDIYEYEVYLKNNSLEEKDFSLFKSIKISKDDIKENNKINTTITIDLKEIQDPNVYIYVVGKSEGKYTQKSDIVNVKETYKSPENIEDYKVNNLKYTINEDNSISISWDKLDKFDCTYSVYIRDNTKNEEGGFELYQYGISDTNINIPIEPNKDINMDVYVVANSSQGASQSSDVINILKTIEEIKPEE